MENSNMYIRKKFHLKNIKKLCLAVKIQMGNLEFFKNLRRLKQFKDIKIF
jgi:hypothetical protein